jgi:hypothetical protein
MSETYKLKGKVIQKDEPQEFSSGFTKQEFVVEVEDGKYPQPTKLECVKDKTALLDDVSIGEKVTATFDIRGNEHNGKYYVNLNCWKLEKEGGEQKQKQDAPAPAAAPAVGPSDADPEDEDDSSIPF